MLQNVYERVLWLAQQAYPDYDEKKNLKDGPLIAMRIGDLIPYQEGFIKSLSYDWNFLGAGGKWELNTNLHNKRMPQGCSIYSLTQGLNFGTKIIVITVDKTHFINEIRLKEKPFT